MEDNGPRISHDKINKLFKKNYQTHTTTIDEKNDRTGLGLAICKGIVDAHAGRIWIEEDYKLGTKIKVSLPID